MFTTYSHPVAVVLASWLETRNQLEKRQEKNEFYFQFSKKNSLDGKNEGRVSMLKRRHVEKILVNQIRPIESRTIRLNW
jgi:hypothetical protein